MMTKLFRRTVHRVRTQHRSLCLQDWKFTNCSSWLRRPRAEHIPLTQASIQPGSIEFSITSRTCFINLYGPQGLVPTALVEGASSDQYPAAVCPMEGNATAQKLSCGSKHSGSYISTEECANGNAPEEFKILGQSRRPSPLSSLRPRKHKYTHVKYGASILFIGIFNITVVNVVNPLAIMR